MYGTGNRTRAKTAKLTFPFLPTSDGQEFISSTNQDVYIHSRIAHSLAQKSYSTLPISMPKGNRVGTPTTSATAGQLFSLSMSTLFPYPPIPSQNPKLKLLKSASAITAHPSKLAYFDQDKTKILPSFKRSTLTQPNKDKFDNNVIKTTITMPIFPHKLNKQNKRKSNIPPTMMPLPWSKLKRKPQEQPEKLAANVSAAPKSNSGDSPNDNTNDVSTEILSPLIGAKLKKAHKEKIEGLPNSTSERFRVNRTEGERETNPDCIRLDKLGLKQFPLVGSEENQLRVFSLQHNLINRLDNLPPLTHLLVLDLYDNRIERITGLHGFTSLKVLLLGKNRIRRIEGLDSLKRLEILDLHGNQLRYVDNLASLSSLRVLNLAGNLIRTIRNLGPYGLSSLMELNLKRNRIRNLEGLQKAPHIKKLYLANNDLQSFSSLHPLRKLIFLQELLLESNPICSLSDYTNQLLTIFPFLEILDKIIVSDQMKYDAKNWHRQRLIAEEERRKELEKIHATLGSTRDEVIFEAKRRWESVKCFVRAKPENETPLPPSAVRPPTSKSSISKLSSINIPNRHILIELEPKLISSQKIAAELSPGIFHDNIMEPQAIAHIFKSTPGKAENASEEVHKLIPENKPSFPNLTKIKEVNESNVQSIDKDNSLIAVSRPISKLTKVAVVRPVIRSKTLEPQPENISTLRNNSTNTNSRLSIPESIDMSTAPQLIQHDKIEDSVSDFYELPQKVVQFSGKTSPSVSEHREFAQTGQNNAEIKPLRLVDESKFSDTLSTAGQVLEIEGGSPKVGDHPLSVSIPDPQKSTCGVSLLVSEGTNVDVQESEIQKEFVGVQRSATPSHLLRRSQSSFELPTVFNEANDKEVENDEELDLISAQKLGTKTMCLKNWRSSSMDVLNLPSGESDTSDVESVATSTNTSDISSRMRPRRQISRTKWRNTRQPSVPNVPFRRPSTCQRDKALSLISRNKPLRRVDSGQNLDVLSPAFLKRQGADYLIEVDGKVLSIYGQGALKHTVPGFSSSITTNVTTVNFHFISYDAIVPYFGKLKAFYPALDNFQFRSNNICTLGQLNALSDLQGIVSLQISSDGNPLVDTTFWKEYAIYRLAHWGLQFVNGKEIVSEYRGGRINSEIDYKMFDSLGYLALSCLPQAALKPLAKRLHTLHCFCCCSPSSSSDESGKKKTNSNSNSNNDGNTCWDDDPVLLDVIGKEALVYTQPETNRAKESQDIALKVLNAGQVILEKLDLLENVWPSMMCEAIQDILTDFMFMDNYMRKELKKLNDDVLANEKLK